MIGLPYGQHASDSVCWEWKLLFSLMIDWCYRETVICGQGRSCQFKLLGLDCHKFPHAVRLTVDSSQSAIPVVCIFLLKSRAKRIYFWLWTSHTCEKWQRRFLVWFRGWQIIIYLAQFTAGWPWQCGKHYRVNAFLCESFLKLLSRKSSCIHCDCKGSTFSRTKCYFMLWMRSLKEQ